MIIEKMAKCHIKEIARLEQICFSSPWSEQSLEEELESENAVFFVAIDNEKILGYGGMQVVFGEGYVTNIAVFPEYQKKGVGKKITKALCDYCEFSISLEVRQSNEKAISLYEKLGFKKVGERKNFYDKPCENALIYSIYK